MPKAFPDLIADEEERLAVARLNLTAGRRAKSSTAYREALDHFRIGADLLPETGWTAHYDLAFDLHQEAAECEYLCGLFEDAEGRFERLLESARTTLDRARVHELRLVLYENRSRYPEAARIGLEGLRLLGITLPEDEAGKRAALEAEMEAIERRLEGRTIESIVDLPATNDPVQQMVMRLLTATWAPFYVLGDPVLPSLISARLVRLSIEQGNTVVDRRAVVTRRGVAALVHRPRARRTVTPARRRVLPERHLRHRRRTPRPREVVYVRVRHPRVHVAVADHARHVRRRRPRHAVPPVTLHDRAMTEIRIQIVNYRTKAFLVDCLSTLFRSLAATPIRYTVAILDNASPKALTRWGQLVLLAGFA